MYLQLAPYQEEGQHWVSPTFICTIRAGEPHIREPAKCAEIGWFSPHAMPDDLTQITRLNLHHYREQVGHSAGTAQYAHLEGRIRAGGRMR